MLGETLFFNLFVYMFVCNLLLFCKVADYLFLPGILYIFRFVGTYTVVAYNIYSVWFISNTLNNKYDTLFCKEKVSKAQLNTLVQYTFCKNFFVKIQYSEKCCKWNRGKINLCFLHLFYKYCYTHDFYSLSTLVSNWSQF